LEQHISDLKDSATPFLNSTIFNDLNDLIRTYKKAIPPEPSRFIMPQPNLPLGRDQKPGVNSVSPWDEIINMLNYEEEEEHRHKIPKFHHTSVPWDLMFLGILACYYWTFTSKPPHAGEGLFRNYAMLAFSALGIKREENIIESRIKMALPKMKDPTWLNLTPAELRIFPTMRVWKVGAKKG
jgi:hypothetical protein